VVQSNIILFFAVLLVCIVVLTRLCELLSLLPAGLPPSGKLPVLFLRRGQKSSFSPSHRGGSLHRFTRKLAQPRGINFTSIGAPAWEGGPQSRKFSLFGKDSLRRGEPFDRFLQLLGAFMRPSTLRMHFKYEVIRLTGYGGIAEKPRVGHLLRIFPCTL